MTDEEKKAIERIEDFLTTNIIISISSDETANSEELKAFISKNEFLSIEFIASMFLKQSKEIEELKNEVMEKELIIDGMKEDRRIAVEEIQEQYYINKDKIKAKIEEYDDKEMTINLVNRSAGKTFQQAVHYEVKEVLQSLLEKE